MAWLKKKEKKNFDQIELARLLMKNDHLFVHHKWQKMALSVLDLTCGRPFGNLVGVQ